MLGTFCHMILSCPFVSREQACPWGKPEDLLAAMKKTGYSPPAWVWSPCSFHCKCYQLYLLLVSDILEGVSPRGQFGSSAVSARGCCGQASSLAVDEERVQEREQRAGVYGHNRSRGGKGGGVCLSDLVSYAQGYNDLRLSGLFIFDVSIFLFSSFWLGKSFMFISMGF